jgi:hypothetical protein
MRERASERETHTHTPAGPWSSPPRYWAVPLRWPCHPPSWTTCTGRHEWWLAKRAIEGEGWEKAACVPAPSIGRSAKRQGQRARVSQAKATLVVLSKGSSYSAHRRTSPATAVKHQRTRWRETLGHVFLFGGAAARLAWPSKRETLCVLFINSQGSQFISSCNHCMLSPCKTWETSTKTRTRHHQLPTTTIVWMDLVAKLNDWLGCKFEWKFVQDHSASFSFPTHRARPFPFHRMQNHRPRRLLHCLLCRSACTFSSPTFLSDLYCSRMLSPLSTAFTRYLQSPDGFCH